MNSIEAYIQFEDGLISEDGHVSNESTREFLQNYMTEFHGFIAHVYTALPRNQAQPSSTCRSKNDSGPR
jgi:chromate reductase